jgi:hypothetical protein
MTAKKDGITEAADEWLVARGVIREFISQLCPGMSDKNLDHNAAAVIARLAQHDPPMLIVYAENVKEG